MHLNKDEALNRLQNICSKQEKCVDEVQKKMAQWKILQSEQDEIVGMLIEDKFIDERRYAKSFVRDKYKMARWGRYKIQYALKGKKISENYIQDGLAEINEDEYLKILESLLIHKNKHLKYNSQYEQTGKLKRFALGRGFLNDEIDKVLEVILNNKTNM